MSLVPDSIDSQQKIPPPSSEETTGTVYVVTNGLYRFINVYKIGFTKDLSETLEEMNRASAFDFRPVFTRVTDRTNELVKKLHQRFDEVKLKREFFTLTEEDLVLLPVICNNILTL